MAACAPGLAFGGPRRRLLACSPPRGNGPEDLGRVARCLGTMRCRPAPSGVGRQPDPSASTRPAGPDTDRILAPRPDDHSTDAARAAVGGSRADARAAERHETWRGLDRASSLSTLLPAAVLTYAGLGWLADRWLQTQPWLLAGGALLGCVLGIYLLIVRSRQLPPDEVHTSVGVRLDAREHAPSHPAPPIPSATTEGRHDAR